MFLFSLPLASFANTKPYQFPGKTKMGNVCFEQRQPLLLLKNSFGLIEMKIPKTRKCNQRPMFRKKRRL